MYPKTISAPIENAATLASEYTGELVKRVAVLNDKARGVVQTVSDGLVVSAAQVGHRLQEVGLHVGNRVKEVGLQVGNRSVETLGKLGNVTKELVLKARKWTVRVVGSGSPKSVVTGDVEQGPVTPLSVV